MKKYCLLFSLAIISCNQEKVNQNFNNEILDTAATVQKDNVLDSVEDLNRVFPKKYSFVVFEGVTYSKARVVCTDIFETDRFMSKDDEYKILDKAQSNPMLGVNLHSITKRYIVSRDSYAEASERKQQILNISGIDSRKEKTYNEIDPTLDSAMTRPKY